MKQTRTEDRASTSKAGIQEGQRVLFLLGCYFCGVACCTLIIFVSAAALGTGLVRGKSCIRVLGEKECTHWLNSKF